MLSHFLPIIAGMVEGQAVLPELFWSWQDQHEARGGSVHTHAEGQLIAIDWNVALHPDAWSTQRFYGISMSILREVNESKNS